MTRVHFCTLHAQCKIVEKIIHLQIIYVWTIKDEVERKLAMAQMESCLSKVGLCASMVVLTKDAKLSGQNLSLLSKLSFNRVKCRKLFKKILGSTFTHAWKDICEAKRNNTNIGQSKVDQQNMWKAFADLQMYFSAMQLTAKHCQDSV